MPGTLLDRGKRKRGIRLFLLRAAGTVEQLWPHCGPIVVNECQNATEVIENASHQAAWWKFEYK